MDLINSWILHRVAMVQLDSEELSVLELVAKTADKTNETVVSFNTLDAREAGHDSSVQGRIESEITSRGLDDNRDFTGTLNGFPIVQAEAGLATTVQGYLAELDSVVNNTISKKTAMLLKLKNTSNYFGERQITVFGDSIGWGSMCKDRNNDSWVGILRKLIQLEYGNKNHGFENFYPPQLTLQGDPMVGLHSCNFGVWTPNVTTLDITKYSYTSTTSGAVITITVPNVNNFFAILYTMQDGGGSIGVSVDGASVGTLNTYGTLQHNSKSQYFAMGGKQTSIITLTKLDSLPTELLGINYMDDPALTSIQNYSRSGATLAITDDTLLDIVASADFLILALGVNDSDLALFTTKITSLITKCNTRETFVIVPDFIWVSTEITQPFKDQLKRLAFETGGVYIGFSEILPMTTFAEYISNGFLADNPHPTEKGHQIIAETIAKTMMLGITGKKQAEKISSLNVGEWQYVESSELITPFTNSYPTANSLKFRYRKSNGNVDVCMIVDTNTAVYTSAIYQLPIGFRPFMNTERVLQVADSAGITPVSNAIMISGDGTIIWKNSPSTYLPSVIMGSFSFPVE